MFKNNFNDMRKWGYDIETKTYKYTINSSVSAPCVRVCGMLGDVYQIHRHKERLGEGK